MRNPIAPTTRLRLEIGRIDKVAPAAAEPSSVDPCWRSRSSLSCIFSMLKRGHDFQSWLSCWCADMISFIAPWSVPRQYTPDSKVPRVKRLGTFCPSILISAAQLLTVLWREVHRWVGVLVCIHFLRTHGIVIHIHIDHNEQYYYNLDI